MEHKSNPERLHGMLIAHASLLKSLVAVLPKETLQVLLPELERNVEAGRVFLLNSHASEDTCDSFDVDVQQYLNFVRDLIH